MPGRSSEQRRRSADERRDLVLDAARQEFAQYGLTGATGESLSYRAGISHPYLLRLFGSKKELFLAVVDQTFDEVLAALRDESVARSDPVATIASYLTEAGASGLFLQLCAACGDEEIRVVARRRFAELARELSALGGRDGDLATLLSRLLLDEAASVMRLGEVARREGWARQLVDSATRS